MAITGGVRWKPDTYRSTVNTTIQNFNPTGTTTDPETGETTETGIPSGGVVMIAQAVAYDTEDFANAPYLPGDPETERKLVILYEEPIVKDLSAFHNMTQAEADAEWRNSLQDFLDRVLPAAGTLVKAVRPARIAPPILL